MEANCTAYDSPQTLLMSAVMKLASGCLAFRTDDSGATDNCYDATCDHVFSIEEIIKRIIFDSAGDSIILIDKDAGADVPRITCDDNPGLQTLFNEVYSNNALRVFETTTDETCEADLCNSIKDLVHLIKSTFVKDSITGCTSILIVDVSDTEEAFACGAFDNPMEIIRRMLKPSIDFPGQYAWAIAAIGSGAETFFLLLESGDHLLLESGDKIILENG